MGEINLTDREINAIKAIDERELSRLIGNAVQEERIGDLYRMPLSDCGADSELKPAGIPINYRPPFRFEAGHDSNQLSAVFRL